MKLVLPAALLLATATLVTPALAHAGGRKMTGQAFAKLAETGEVNLEGVTIGSRVDLSDRTITKRFTCRNCHFQEAFVAVGTTFEGIADFRGSTFSGNVAFRKATFGAAALFGSPTTAQGATKFSGSVDFSLATFGDLATFENSVFQARDSTASQRGCDVALPDTTDFQLARFEKGATFVLDAIYGDADFSRAMFAGTVDFNSTTFWHQGVFDGSEFTGPVNFGGGMFICTGSFQSARLDMGGTFLGTNFSPCSPCSQDDKDSKIDDFSGLQSGGTLNFSFATLGRTTSFDNMVVNGGITFHGATLPQHKVVSWVNVSATSLELDVGKAIKAVAPADLPDVLADIESSAKDRGDLSTANDADYERKVLDSRKRGWLGHALDVFFYRWIAGYLVRPLQPLAALLALALALTLLHAGRKAWPHPAATSRGWWNRLRSQAGRARRILPPLGNAYLESLALVVPGKGPPAKERPVRWLEVIAYRLRFVCILIGFANSNPTLRQMLDAIR
ncbi:MAG TPA: pentapeptide repeat-containing protein [Gaiellaceae bacterium]|nr:pentapeptide repeat-containing protein [Gaiellaceae bacterium]